MTHKTLLEVYQAKCRQGVICEDNVQVQTIIFLQSIYDDLVKAAQKRKGIFSRWQKRRVIKGAYLWGSVGIGKTWLMDLFFEHVPVTQKKRMHFHAFMQWVHRALKAHQGEKNPLEHIAKKLSRDTLLLCFDELTVADITDAMILGRLFQALFAEGVCVLLTSNVMPDDLYKNGLQRQLFLPAIALIKMHTEVMHLSSQLDYRLHHLQKAGVFYTPHDDVAEQNMQTCFDLFSRGDEVQTEAILVHGRSIAVQKKTENVVWFDFHDICHVPRSQQDYLAIATQFHTVFLSNIPAFPPHAKDKITLFIRLIDVLYDARVRLVFSAAVSLADIYSAGHLLQDFARTYSRLMEMQTEVYFSRGLTV